MYTPQEHGILQSAQSAIGRVSGGGALGIGVGAAVHAAAAANGVGGAPPPFVDTLVNAVDLTVGGTCGLFLGALWACDAALVASGAIYDYFNGTLSSLVGEEEDERAGERALQTVRDGMQTLAARGDLPLRLAFFLTGLDQEPAVASLVEEAQATRRRDASPRKMSAILATCFTSTLQQRLDDARLLVVGLGALLAGGADGVLWWLGAALAGG